MTSYCWSSDGFGLRKPNPARMRRYIARTTPDRVEGHFDAWHTDYEHYKYLSEKWVKEFFWRMKIKHGPNVQVNYWLVDIDRFKTPYETIIHAEARKPHANDH